MGAMDDNLDEVHLFSRSDVEEDWRCPRGRYWRSVFGGRGLEVVGSDMDLMFGTIVHAATAQMLKGADASAIAKQAGEHFEAEYRAAGAPQWLAQSGGDPEQFFRERRTLIHGLSYGWSVCVLPQLRAMGRLELVEHEVTLSDRNLRMMTQPDLLVEPPEMNEVIYLEWKTCKSAGPGWFLHWTTAPQFMAAALAVKQSLGMSVGMYQVVGMCKGEYRDGWQHSPFVWGWRYNLPNGDRDYAYQWEDARKKGWERFPVWEVGVEEWVRSMPPELLAKQFPQTVPLPISELHTQAFAEQVMRREEEIWEFTKRDDPEDGGGCGREVTFPQHFTACNPYMGKACWAHELCWQPAVGSDPIGSGKFVWRTSHHELERKKQGIAWGDQ